MEVGEEEEEEEEVLGESFELLLALLLLGLLLLGLPLRFTLLLIDLLGFVLSHFNNVLGLSNLLLARLITYVLVKVSAVCRVIDNNVDKNDKARRA